jgi:hypothetical protein
MVLPKQPVQHGVNKFFWWRRFPTHKTISKYHPYPQKIENGDFDYSPYFQQAEWELGWMEQDITTKTTHCKSIEGINEVTRNVQETYYRRYNKLLEDAMKDEHNRLDYLKENLIFTYGGDKNLCNEVMEKCDGDLYQLFKDYQQAVKLYKSPIVEQIKRKRGRPPKIK